MPPRSKKPSASDLASQPDPRAPLDSARFLAAARPVLRALANDLRTRADASPAVTRGLRALHEAESRARRTADAYEPWRRRYAVQVASAWLLSAVFVRTLEDRGLLRRARLAGPGALDSQAQFQAIAPFLGERDYLVTVLREAASFPALAALFDLARSPMGKLAPSSAAVRELFALLRAPNAEAPAFRFGQADTRFLGDLYQDLDEEVRERFALLQTPHFVESYILDRTLERVVAERGPDAASILDPTCGSGHFLLGAFDRLVEHHQRARPAEGPRGAAKRALAQIAGVDVNPYAVAIARMRLTLAFLDRAGLGSLDQAPELPWNLAVADSLLHGTEQPTLADAAGQSPEAWLGERFALEDAAAARRVLGKRYAVVVGNPPYITVKDAALREEIRKAYASAAGKYALAAPFLERFFLLAEPGGRIGTITANSFMKREFGKKLIEQVLPNWQLDAVINTSGAYIPGHGTPTVILFGRNLPPEAGDVHAVLAKRGEPSTPADPSNGQVWSSIRDHGDEMGYEDEFLSVAKVARSTLNKHPWSLGGGGAAELKELLEERAEKRLGDLATSIGISAVTGEDDVYLLPPTAAHRRGLAHLQPMVTGEVIRDWTLNAELECVFPYDDDLRLLPLADAPDVARHLWPYSGVIRRRKRFGVPMVERGLTTYELQELYADKLRTPLTITFAFVATHNHFVLDRGGKVFNRSAPIIKLKEGATEDDHLALLAYLNSSTACFWMKQVCFPKGSHSEARPEKGIEDENRYEFAGTALLPLPVVSDLHRLAVLVPYARDIESLSRGRAEVSPAAAIAAAIAGEEPLTTAVARAEAEDARLLRRMIAVQDDLDWKVYELFQLASTALAARMSPGASLSAGERPFAAAAPPPLAPPDLDLWAMRKVAAQNSAELASLEAPVFKRKWWGARGVFASKVATYEERAVDAAIEWLADLVEESLRVGGPRGERALRSHLRLDERVARALDFVARCYSEADAWQRALGRNAVPFLAALRHTDAGLEKRALWEQTWALQRREDVQTQTAPRAQASGPAPVAIPVPPKYDPKDFRSGDVYRLRGPLDVPKERFISYPGCSPDDDPSPLYGWAGWHHLEQAQALVGIYNARKADGWDAERLTPILAGIAELVPWILQWHDEPDPETGERAGASYQAFVEGELRKLRITGEALAGWRPAAKGKRGAKKAGKAAEQA